MEVNELPQFDPNVDYNVILPIHQKRTVAFINHFVSSTVSFLNNFCESCESRLLEFEYKLQKVEASLLILEAQLASIPDIETVEKRPDPVTEESPVVDTIDLPEIVGEEVVSEVSAQELRGPKACDDPRYKKFFKMVKVGVHPQAVRLKMQSEGIDSNILDKPNETIPGYEPPSSSVETSGESDSD